MRQYHNTQEGLELENAKYKAEKHKLYRNNLVNRMSKRTDVNYTYEQRPL